jgi:hypothetical protein
VDFEGAANLAALFFGGPEETVRPDLLQEEFPILGGFFWVNMHWWRWDNRPFQVDSPGVRLTAPPFETPERVRSGPRKPAKLAAVTT